MTARDIYDAVGVELNKVKAPAILLEDFNYFLNKSVIQATNKFYNSYDISQQTTDDIRVLKATAELAPIRISDTSTLDLYGAACEAYLPPDYYHILNVICKFVPTTNYKSYKKDVPLYVGARRLVADSWPVLVNNLYNRPSYKMPYYYLHNVNTSDINLLSTNPYEDKSGVALGVGTDNLLPNMLVTGATKAIYSGIPAGCTTIVRLQAVNGGIDGNNIILTFGSGTKLSTMIDTWNAANTGNRVELISGDLNQIPTVNITLSGGKETKTVSLANSEKEAAYRYGNASSVRIELRYGKDVSVFALDKIYVDYIKSPQYIILTEEQIDTTLDKSQMMEFPDYVNYEIINILVGLILENTSNPRLNTNIPLAQTIAPAQAQIQMQQAKEQIKNM